MQTEIRVKGFLTSIKEHMTKQNKKFATFSVATNIYNFKERDENGIPKAEGTIWTNFIFWGELSNAQVGMPVFVEGHLSLSQNEQRQYNLVADTVSLNLNVPKSNQYIKEADSQ